MTKYYHSYKSPYRYFSENLLNIVLLIIFSAIVFFTVSCEEDPTAIGKKILPADDFVDVFSTDTINVWSYTMYSDSVESDNPTYSYLGQIYDPYFGTTTAGFVTQLRLNKSGVNETFTVIDSVKLFLKLTDVRGNTAAGHLLNLSEIAEQIYTASDYYSSESVQLTGFSIDVELPELQADTINDIILNIPHVLGDTITNKPSMLFHSSNSDTLDFNSYFKGLYFRLIPAGEPVFMTLSLYSTGTYNNYFVIYYHNDLAEQKELYLLLDAVNRNACFNTYSHNFDAAEPEKKIQHINDGFRDTLTYLQCLNGVYIKMALPGLNTIKNDPLFTGISVNKARVICPALFDGNLYKPSTFPSQLFLRYVDAEGNKTLVPDLDIYSSSYGTYPFFDGKIDTTAGVYKFNVASYVQDFFEDSGDILKPELEIFLPSSSIINAILKANNSTSPVRFEFTYTRF